MATAVYTYHARIDPRTKDAATFIPTSIPDPIKAGVHSINQPQLSIAMAVSAIKPVDAIQVKICQSCVTGKGQHFVLIIVSQWGDCVRLRQSIPIRYQWHIGTLRAAA